MGLRGLVVLTSSHTFAIFSSPLFALDLRLATFEVSPFCFFRLERRGRGREQESVYGIVGVSSRCRRSRGFPSSSRKRVAFHERVRIQSSFVVLESAKGSLVRGAQQREKAQERGSVRVRDGGEIWAGMWASYCIYGSFCIFLFYCTHNCILY